MGDQTAMFEDGEGDAWFRRNAPALSAERADDPALAMARELIGRGEIASLCEFGCANGWRLAALSGSVARLAGFDVSAEAIRDGRGRWPQLDLRVGVADAPPFDERFDLVIVSFVLHWIGRDRLARTVAAINAGVSDGGYLILADFLPSAPRKNPYHHRPNGEAYTYKQDYRQEFFALGTYTEISSRIFGHGADEMSDANRAVCSLLRKDLRES